MPDIEITMRKLFESYGGKEKYFKAVEKRLAEFNSRWNQDIGAMGRVLRSHLIVEYYMTAYLQKANPNLGVIDNAKIGFAQKVDLLGDNDVLITELIPGDPKVEHCAESIGPQLVRVREPGRCQFIQVNRDLLGDAKRVRKARWAIWRGPVGYI